MLIAWRCIHTVLRTYLSTVQSADVLCWVCTVRRSELRSATGTAPKHWLDGGAACVIRTLRILSPQGEELERIESYNLLHSILDQYETSYHDITEKNAKEGFIQYIDPSIGFDSDLCDSLETNSSNRVVATNQQRHYEVHLKGAWFNTKMQKLLLPGIQFQIEITLDAANNCMVARDYLNAGGTLDYNVQNVLFKAPVVRIEDPAFNSAVRNMMQQGYWWSGKSYRLYTNTVDLGTGDAVIPISDNRLETVDSMRSARASESSRTSSSGTSSELRMETGRPELEPGV